MSNFGYSSLPMCSDATVGILEMEFLGLGKHASEMLIVLAILPSQKMCPLEMYERACFPKEGVHFYG